MRRCRDVRAKTISCGDRGPSAACVDTHGPAASARRGARVSLSAADLGVPATFNAATYFVDRNIETGRGDHVAIECGADRITYRQVRAGVNRFGSALRSALDVRPEERILLLLTDGPAFVYCFFGAIKIGAVPIPINTLWTPADYQFVLDDSRASVLVVSES